MGCCSKVAKLEDFMQFQVDLVRRFKTCSIPINIPRTSIFWLFCQDLFLIRDRNSRLTTDSLGLSSPTPDCRGSLLTDTLSKSSRCAGAAPGHGPGTGSELLSEPLITVTEV